MRKHNRQTSKILSLLLTVAMTLTMLPLTAAAEADGCTHDCADGTCAYIEGADCGHIHGDSCGEDGADCTHDCADGTCGYIEAVDCDHVCDADCGGLSSADSGQALGTSGVTAATARAGIMPLMATVDSTMNIGGLTGIDLTVDHNATACSNNGHGHGHTPTGWEWNANTDTLTLDNNYTGEGIYIECGASDNITLVLNGNVTINSAAFGISVAGIAGTGNTGGSLTVKAGSNTLAVTAVGDALQANGGIAIESGTVLATGDNGICSYYGDVTISGSANVTATGTGTWSNGIQAAGDVIINTTGTVTAASGGNFSGIRAQGSIQIDNGTVTAKGSQGGALNADNGIIISGGTVTTDNTAGGAGGDVVGDLTVSGATANVTVNGDIDGDFTVSGGTVNVTGDVTGDLDVSDGAVTIDGDVDGATTVTGGTVSVNGSPILPTTYTATLNINLDGAPLTTEISNFTLKLSGNESTAVSMAGSGAARTASVPNGTWKVYLGANEYTGVDIIVNGGPASATLDYYSESHSVNPQGAATGGTISISINGTDYGDQTYSSLSFMKGDEVVFTAAGIGSVDYTYAWSGTHNGNPISGTGNTFTIASVSGIVNITCTVTGNNSPGDTTPPTVTAISPANNATGVARSGNISITFSEAIGTTGTVKLSGAALSATGSWSGNTYTIPYSGLAYNSKYTVAISGFKDTAGNTMADNTANSFTTMADPNSSSGNGNGGNGGGGGGTTTTPSTNVTTEKQPNMPTVAKQNVTGTVKDNTLSFTITETMVKNAIAAATNKVDGIAVRFDLTGTGYGNISGTFNRAALEALKSAGVKYVQFTSAVLDLTLDLKTIEAALGQTTGNVTVSAVMLDKLSDAAKALIGNRPVFDITIKGANGVTVSDLKGGTATIGIVYTPKSGEKTGNLYGVYVDKNGKPQLLTNSSYDGGKVIFSRSSLSIYGVGYKTPAPAFTDTDKHWAKDDIDFVASRGLISGTTATTFSPDTAITRADFLMALGKLSGADVSGYKTSSFTDVSATNAAMPYIEWAVKNKIVQGIGDNKFDPDNKISRQDMAVMMLNYAKATGYTLPVSRQAVTFADNDKISAYAKDAEKAIQQAGIIVGKTGNLFDPKGNATRAEASTILRRFVELVIDEGTARGWVQNDSGQWQYINTYGKAVTGWLDTTAGSKYWFDDKGIMAAGKWVQIEGKWYYFDASGKLATNTTIDGYEVGADGARKEK